MKKAFTIIELVIVISVLIILIGIAIPRMKGMQQSGTMVKVKGELQTLQAAVESYYSNSSPNVYPGVAGSSIMTMSSTYLVSATPQIITGPPYDPFNPNPSTEYGYSLSSNGQYYVVSSVGPNGQWGCFASGTMVLLADGKTKPIERLRIGDILLGPQKTMNKVIALKILPAQVRNLYSFNGERYFVTDDHIFMTQNGWEAINPKKSQNKYSPLKVSRLKVGDVFITFNGKLRLKTINFKTVQDSVVYDPQLNGSHLYYANGFLVHNPPVQPGGSIPTVGPTGAVSKGPDDICVTNGTGC